MNTQFLLALKRYLEDQHNSAGSPFSPSSPNMCLQCFTANHKHTLYCPVGNLIKEIDTALVVAVREEQY